MKKKHTVSQKEGSGSPRKSRMKEAKETRQLFETIAKKLLIDCTTNANHKLEVFCEELINRRFTEVRQDVAIMESSLSSRIALIEHKVNDIGAKLTDLSTDVVRQNTLMREDVAKLSLLSSEGLEAERQKRLAAIKKMQGLAENNTELCKTMINNSSKDYLGAVTSLNEDFRVQSKEITRLKESVDEMLTKRYGFLPGTSHKGHGDNLASTFNQGLDAGVILDNLAQRVKSLETQFGAEDDFDNLYEPAGQESSFHRQNGGSRGFPTSPLRSLAGGSTLHGNGNGTVGRKIANNKIRRLEESIYDLRAQLQACESDVHEVKSTVISKLRHLPGSPSKSSHHNHHHSLDAEFDQSQGAGGSSAEIRSLQKKLKKLAENTTRACRSLSTGLTDVQQATLNLYAWTDSAHDAFGKVSHELGMKGNVCTRARVYQPQSRVIAASDMFAD